MFEENGWTVPESYGEFVALCQTIDASGIRGCRYVYHDANMQMFNYCARSAVDTLTTVEGQTWHSRLLAGEDVTLEPMETAFLDLQKLMDAGIVRAEDLGFSKDMRNVSLLDREQAIGAAEIAVLHKLCEEGGDEFRFMPHFSYTDGEAWLLNLGYYFGANKKLREKGNEEKQEAVMEILSFIATEEGQDLLIEDGIGMVPSTRGAAIPDDPLLENIRSQIENGRYMVRPVYNMFSSVLSTEIASFIRGETTSDAILKKCRDARKEGASEPAALGQAESDFTVWQTALLKADALREAAAADVALMGVAETDGYAPVGGTRSRIYEGAITEDDVLRVNQLKINTPLPAVRGTLSGEELLEILEYGAASEGELEAGVTEHYHPFAVSGLTLTYEPGAEAGSRVFHVKLADGMALDLEADYTVAYLDGALAEGTVSDDKMLELSMADLFRAYILKEETVKPDEKRIKFR